jgi:mRNA interferase MazF
LPSDAPKVKKDFWKWHQKKQQIHASEGTALFQEREVWWCILGENVGFEQDGRGELFARPVVILAKFNLNACLVVPLTAKSKKGKFYFEIGEIAGRNAVAVLSQLRFIDRKRLADKIATLDKDMFRILSRAVVNACFPEVLK